MVVRKVLKKGIKKIDDELAKVQGRYCSREYNLNGWKRVYLIHIRKTAGTSLNHMFLDLASSNGESTYSKLASSRAHVHCDNGFNFVGWNKELINAGFYFYGFSHIPYHQLMLPDLTYKITVFRDPVKRVLSHYKMLSEYRRNNIQHPCMKEEGSWLGSGIEDFVRNIPKEHCLNQLYMFSPRFDVSEAVEKVSDLERVLFTDNFELGVRLINQDLGLELQPVRRRISNCPESFSDQILENLREKLSKEYEFLEQVKKRRETEVEM